MPAFQVSQYPQLFAPVYNPMHFRVASTATANPNFKFIIDIGRTGSTSTSIARIKTFTVPNGAYANFSPARILEGQVSYDLSQNTIGFVNQTNCIFQYDLQFGQEYGSPTPTQYLNLNERTGYTWNAVFNYVDMANWNNSLTQDTYTAYTLINSSNKFLTHAPATQLIKDSERASLSMISFNSNVGGGYPIGPQYMRIKAYHNSGGTKTSFVNNFAISAYTSTGKQVPDNQMINHFGSGMWNLEQLQSSDLFVGTVPVVVSTDKKYEVTAVYFDGFGFIDCSETKTYLLDTYCSKYQSVRLLFLNSLGGMDYFTFTLVSRLTTNTTREQYKKILAPLYTIGNRQNTVVNSNSQQSQLVTSNWVDQATSNWLASELFNSREVYELQDDGSVLPVILDINSIETKKSINDKLINYEIPYTYSFDLNTSRG